MLNQNLIAKTSPVALDENIRVVGDLRFTVLTDRLVRVERKPFCDDATQSVWFRDMPPVKFTIESAASVIIRTESTTFFFLKSGKLKYAALSDGRDARVSRRTNLKGTMRTLDRKGKHVRLGDGVISRSGVAVLDDGSSLILTSAGTVKPRAKCFDKYYFAYGTDYRGALQAFYALTGPAPMLPRGVLGNWWSRYHQYTQDEYMAVVREFEKRDITLTVATVDMDWHWVDVKLRFGEQKDGWTGYSWNTELFPDYRAFLAELQQKGLMVTLNLHPADGVRSFEVQYAEMARRMGVDPETKATIPFDLSNDEFINAYFEVLHRPFEKEGVNFWWIDWQQGKKSTVSGLDPLWALNHYHYLDNSALGNRPVILSRFAGAGSHRYPLGFSGDTRTTWGALSVQPYVTATAANIGYTWWSHDIGGHMLGRKDEEMYLRWVQLGVFSPINRLHCTSEEYVSKAPWAFTPSTERIATDYLKLRHRLIPYIYSCGERTYSKGVALCEPLYYTYQHDNNAYYFTNQYFFGSELMVSPIVEKSSPHTRLGTVETWFPNGRWTDIFTGKIYNGNCVLPISRDVSNYPVFAKEGAIIPLSADPGNSIENPKALEIWVYRGSGNFTLYEDGNDAEGYKNGVFAQTKYMINEGQKITFCISAATGDLSVLPQKRSYRICFKDLIDGVVTVLKDGAETEYKTVADSDCVIVDLPEIAVTSTVEISVDDHVVRQNKDYFTALTESLAQWEGPNPKKMPIYSSYYGINSLQYLLNGRTRKPLKKCGRKKAMKLAAKPFFRGVLHVPKQVRELLAENIAISPDEDE